MSRHVHALRQTSHEKTAAWGEPHVEWAGVGVSRHGLAPHRGP